ncbi:hypothetical protein SSS_06249, partial [Sarcoptes scabiei]
DFNELYINNQFDAKYERMIKLPEPKEISHRLKFDPEIREKNSSMIPDQISLDCYQYANIRNKSFIRIFSSKRSYWFETRIGSYFHHRHHFVLDFDENILITIKIKSLRFY